MQGKALNYNALSEHVGDAHRHRPWSRCSTTRFPFTWRTLNLTVRENCTRGVSIRSSMRTRESRVTGSFGRLISLGQIKLESIGTWHREATRGTAGNSVVDDGSQTLVCIDPPYYDNVMYGELSDFFGVWEQHTVGQYGPTSCPADLPISRTRPLRTSPDSLIPDAEEGPCRS